MKIAFSSMDGEKISSHFGRSKYFVILEVENGEIVGREIRENPHAGKHHHGGKEENLHHQGHSWIQDMFKDCEVIVTKRIGEGAFKNLQRLGKKVIIVESSDIEDVLKQL